MEKLRILFFALVLFTVSCSDDELLSDNIVGRWDFTNLEIIDCSELGSPGDLTPDGDGCVSLGGEVSCDIYFEFKSDGTAFQYFTQDGSTDVESYTYTVNDDTNVVTICDEYSDCETLTADGDKLTYSLQDVNCDAIITYEK